MADEDKPLLPEGQSRPLTPGEIELAKGVFGNAVDYSQVRVHRKAYMFGQDDYTAMTPDGNMYYPSKIYKDDFSKADSGAQGLFIHEMTHVWQKQQNLFDPVPAAIGLWWDKGMNYHAAYDISKVSAFKDLKDYNMEQQAELVRSFFEMKERRKEGEDVFKPTDYEKLENSKTMQLMLKQLGELYRKDPDNPMVKIAKGGFGGPGVVFEHDGTAHFRHISVDEQRRLWEERHRHQEIADKTLASIMFNFSRDPAYVSKCPIVELPSEDSRLVTEGPKTTGMG